MSQSPPTARVVTEGAQPSHRSHRVLVGLAISLAAYLVMSVASAAMRTMVSLRVRQDGVDLDTDPLLALADKTSLVFELGRLTLTAAVAVCLVLLAHHLWSRRRERDSTSVLTILIAAAVVAVLNLLVDVTVSTLMHAGHREWVLRFWQKPNVMFGLNLLEFAGVSTMVWALVSYVGAATERTRVAIWMAALATVWSVGFSVYSFTDYVESPWWRLALRTAPWLIILGSTSFLAWSGRRSIGPLPVAESRSESQMRWLSASGNLGLYGTALLWRLVVTISAYGLLYVAFESQSLALVKFIGWALPVVTLVLGVVMTVAVIGYANQPRSSRGREPAYVSGALMAFGSCIDLVLFVTLVRASRTGSDGLYNTGYELQAQLRQIQAIAPWTLILAFASLLLLLLSFRSVARRLGRSDLVTRAVTVFALVLGASAITVGLRFWIAGKSRLSQDEALLAVVVLLTVVAVAIASYLRLLRGLQETINDHALAPEGTFDLDDEGPTGWTDRSSPPTSPR